ncbi:MAG: hypothetical protein K0Q59_2225, partial [Paenibacillus sp.]|nr:hypothetical protein [Paenibacillus sp.]
VKDFVVLDRSDLLPLVAELNEKSGQFTVLANLQIASILDQIVLSCVQMLDNDTSFRSQMLMLMNMNLSENLTLGELSNRLAVSTSTLERFTNREFGCSAIGLYLQLKLSKACSLLINSELSMKQIAETLGFFDQAHFSRFFKQKMNMSPIRYKQINTL